MVQADHDGDAEDRRQHDRTAIQPQQQEDQEQEWDVRQYAGHQLRYQLRHGIEMSEPKRNGARRSWRLGHLRLEQLAHHRRLERGACGARQGILDLEPDPANGNIRHEGHGDTDRDRPQRIKCGVGNDAIENKARIDRQRQQHLGG